MAEQDFEARLRQLQEVLDERVTLLSKPKRPKQRYYGGKSRPSNASRSQNDGQPSSQAYRGPAPTAETSHRGAYGSSAPNRTPAPGTSSRETDSAMEFLSTCNFEVGKSISHTIAFCPWNAVISYPGRFIGKTNRPRARVYFDSIYEGRSWDFFYLHNPDKPSNEPFLLVPTAQFVAFLDHINKCLKIALVIPRGHEKNFSVSFSGPGIPKPRYLVRSSDQRTFKIETYPEIADDDLELYESMESPRQKEIQKFLEVFTSRHPDKVKKDKRREKEDEGMLLDAQRMLGVKSAMVDLDVVFICVDVEALERKPNPVSEIGIAVLDTRDIKDVLPGPAGRDWWPHIKAHHLRVKEYSGLRNHIFVHGCPDKFSFGKSIFPPKAEVTESIMDVLRPWYPSDRDLVLVGHDVRQDIKYLAELDVKTADMRFIREIDSQVMHKSWRKLKDGRGLDAVLSELCIQFNHLHNAGNDAMYTLRAMVGVAVEQAREEMLLASGEKYVPALFAI